MTEIFGQTDAYFALSLSQLSRPGSVSGEMACVSRTFRFAHSAIDALVRVDDEHVLAFVEAIDGTDLDAVHVFAFDACFNDDVGHAGVPVGSVAHAYCAGKNARVPTPLMAGLYVFPQRAGIIRGAATFGKMADLQHPHTPLQRHCDNISTAHRPAW